MPQRFLRPGITSSESFNAISLGAQSFYIRLLTLVDDFGRFEASSKLLKSLTFPICDNILVENIKEWENELANSHSEPLVFFYIINGKRYLQINKWQERARTNESRYPAFEGNPQPTAAQRSDPLPSEAIAISPKPSPMPAASCASLPSALDREDFKAAWERWLSHLKQLQIALTGQARDLHLKACLEWGADFSIICINHSIAGNWKKLYAPDGEQIKEAPKVLDPIESLRLGQLVKEFRAGNLTSDHFKNGHESDQAKINPLLEQPERIKLHNLIHGTNY